MQPPQSSWTLSDEAVASNPGNIRVNMFRWFRHYPAAPLIWFGAMALFSVLALLWHWGWWIGAGLMLFMNVFYWMRVREHFRHGCANPALVVSLDPMLIAVSTDLSKGLGDYPAIKIIEKELTTVCGQSPQVGSRLAAIALYGNYNNHDLPHWELFDPRPVDCATNDL